MALTYSLKYKKINFFQKVVMEKEGEIIIDRNSFRLKGKGAQDMGENIFFSDMKDLFIKDDLLMFTTYTKEKYVLSSFSSLFDSFIKDFMKVRNEFLAENLFMKVGMLVREYDGAAEIINTYEKSLNKGKSRIQIYEGSIVIIPELKECVVIYLDFLKSHEFDEDEYVLKLTLDNGNTIKISKLGTYFEDAKETMETLMGKMYERILNNLNEALPGFDPATLLKLANKVKGGKAVQFSTFKKLHDDLPSRLFDLAIQCNVHMGEKMKLLRSISGDENFYLGFAFSNREKKEMTVKALMIAAIPEKNIVAIGLSGCQDSGFYFFRIIMEQGDAKEKLPAKIMEINQSMVIFRYDLNPLLRDRREINKSKYRTAVKRLSYLRLLRKSFLAKSVNVETDRFSAELDKIFEKALVLPKNTGGNGRGNLNLAEQ